MLRILDREGKPVAAGEDIMDIAGEESQLWRDEDGEGEFEDYSTPISRGEEREYIWKKVDGTQIIIGSLVCE
jgi:hypothetical protein